MIDGRNVVLTEARQAVMKDRNAEYAPPELNFQRIADFWNTYLEGREITPYDTSIMMILVKVARCISSPHQVDHLVDIAGYAACAADVAPLSELKQALEDFDPYATQSDIATDGGQEGDIPAHYEGSPGFLRGTIWYGEGGRKVDVPEPFKAQNAGVFSFDQQEEV